MNLQAVVFYFTWVKPGIYVTIFYLSRLEVTIASSEAIQLSYTANI
ncbi:hypothetical protein HBA_0796 [Sodalis endosymbiont of Henestaris halophilus]|nr:hypothetical protein HBA_0796 [Sodalis endosymbiont of Henestaris halophilus]